MAQTISRHLLEQLRRDLAQRRIQKGFARLNAHRKLFDSLNPGQRNGPALIGYLAQWVDIGFGDAVLIKEILSRFPKLKRVNLSLTDYVHLRMAEGLVAMLDENFEHAIRHFQVVLSVEDEITNKELISITNFWIGRCQRRGGRYQDALNYVLRGRKHATQLNYPKMSAVMQVLEGWIAFQQEKPNEALRILAEAEADLSETDDYVTLGNIQSAYGRIARRQGRFQQALNHFEKAIEHYRKRNKTHHNIARTLLNIAHVKRLIALQLRAKIDLHAEKRRTRGAKPGGAYRKIPERGDFQRLHEEAFDHLAAAEETYARYKDHRGLGGVHVTSGYLYLDEGELDQASRHAAKAFETGAEKSDYILQARARMLQSAVESARFEEQLDDATASHHPAQSANDYAREAVEFAKNTQSRRLLAKAYITLGMNQSSEFFNELAAAQQSCDKAAALLNPKNQDYVWRELQLLKTKLQRAGKMDGTLREWSQGIVGDKTFQQISEEFAQIIIPNVWKREGRKVSRVSDRLSISPKKVRRILRNVGVLSRTSGDV